MISVVRSQPWRLIPPLTTNGQTQMAIDAWLFEQHGQGQSPPTLRFYTWSPVALSLGYHQRHYPKHWQQLRWQGQPIDCVRRPTGGRAVLHQGDLTYAVITGGLSGNRRQGYEYVCKFLITGWQRLGLSLAYGQARRSYGQTPNCFATATGADLVTPTGLKLIGSAQRRDRDRVLQHGSMRLRPDPALFQQVFQETVVPAPALGALPLQQQQIVEVLTTAAADHFNADFFVQPLTAAEIEQALSRRGPGEWSVNAKH